MLFACERIHVVCVRIQMGYVRMPYVCARILLPENPDFVYVCFFFCLIHMFYLLFNLFYLSLSLCLSVLFHFIVVLSLRCLLGF